MSNRNLMRAVALSAAFAASGAIAQTHAQATAPTPLEPAPVVTDVGPAPAHERDSLGAIVLDESLRPQRDRSFEEPAPRAQRKAKRAIKPAVRPGRPGSGSPAVRPLGSSGSGA